MSQNSLLYNIPTKITSPILKPTIFLSTSSEHRNAVYKQLNSTDFLRKRSSYKKCTQDSIYKSHTDLQLLYKPKIMIFQFPRKHQRTSTKVHSVTTQEISLIIATTMRTSNPILFYSLQYKIISKIQEKIYLGNMKHFTAVQLCLQYIASAEHRLCFYCRNKIYTIKYKKAISF